MLNTTADAIRSLLKADPSLTPGDRRAILAQARNHGRTTDDHKEAAGPQLITRKQAAALLNRSPRTVDLLAKAGSLERVYLTGMQRAAGYRKADVVALIQGKGV